MPGKLRKQYLQCLITYCLREKYYPVEQYRLLHLPREIKNRKWQQDKDESNGEGRPIAMMKLFDSNIEDDNEVLEM